MYKLDLQTKYFQLDQVGIEVTHPDVLCNKSA